MQIMMTSRFPELSSDWILLVSGMAIVVVSLLYVMFVVSLVGRAHLILSESLQDPLLQ